MGFWGHRAVVEVGVDETLTRRNPFPSELVRKRGVKGLEENIADLQPCSGCFYIR